MKKEVKMSVALYEFPLCEKVRNYLRLEQLCSQLFQARHAQTDFQYLYVLDTLFNIIDMVDRLDLRTDFVRDIDAHEKKLVQWSQHPDIDQDALTLALKNLHKYAAQIKQNKKLGASFKEDKFLNTIKQRFGIPGGATSFDLPILFCWLKTNQENKQTDVENWISQLTLIFESLQLLLSFLREKTSLQSITSSGGYYQGSAEERIELVRIQINNDDNMYPVVSGSRNRFGVKFMRFDRETGLSDAVTSSVTFHLACC